jgi:hypothetical protein
VHVVDVPEEEQSPLQPANSEPGAAAAISVTVVPSSKDAEQVEPQSIPAGLLVIVPAPVPDFVTVSEY